MEEANQNLGLKFSDQDIISHARTKPGRMHAGF